MDSRHGRVLAKSNGGEQIGQEKLIIIVLACIAVIAIACSKSEEEKQQDQAIAAAEKYQDVPAAIAAGYLPTEDCVQSPAGVMGLHYVNPALIQDPSIDITQPEVLIYQPSASGGVTLVAIEYLFALGPPGSDAPPNPPAGACTVRSDIRWS